MDTFLRLETWIDASHVLHPNMRGQIGGEISFVWGIFYGKYVKQKLNAKNTTDSEVVEVMKYISYKIYLMFFLNNKDKKLIGSYYIMITRVPSNEL